MVPSLKILLMKSSYLSIILILLFVSCTKNHDPILIDDTNLHGVWKFDYIIIDGVRQNNSNCRGFDRITIDTDKNRVKWTSSSMDKFPCIRTSINFNYDLKNDKINLYNNNYIKNVSIVDFSDARLTLEGYQWTAHYKR